jgi:hypothetical protein
MEYRVVDLRSSRSPAVSEWQRARRDLWPGHTEWCFKLPPGSMKVCVRSVKGPVASPPSALLAFLVKGRCWNSLRVCVFRLAPLCLCRGRPLYVCLRMRLCAGA